MEIRVNPHSIGTYTTMPMIWTLTCLNFATPMQKGIGCAFVVGIGNVGGFVSSWMFRTSNAPKYTEGMKDSLILSCVAVFLTAVARVYIILHNKMQNKEGSDGPESDKEDLATGKVLY